MFIWDFAIESTFGQMIDYFYGQVVEFLTYFFELMGNMGAELFELPWVEVIVTFFGYFGWALFAVGLVVAVFEFGVEFQTGRGNMKDMGMNTLKGFMACGLFTVLPVELYSLSVSLQGELTRGISGIMAGGEWSIGRLAFNTIAGLTVPGGGHIMYFLFVVIAMGYCCIKVFFANLKRGGILLIQIAVGSLYMFSVPRGYIDGFMSWAKQVIGVCLTAFLQTTILVAGLLVFNDHTLLGLGLMLSAGEIPRICGAFGLDTSTRNGIMSVVYGTQQAMNITKSIFGGGDKSNAAANAARTVPPPTTIIGGGP